MGSRPAVSLVFLSTGIVFGTWAARLPTVKAELGLSDVGLSIALITLEGGALLGLPLGGRLVARHGSRHTLRWSLPLFAAALTSLAIAPNLPLLAAGAGPPPRNCGSRGGLWLGAVTSPEVSVDRTQTSHEDPRDRP
jgi:MFS family permease